MASAVNRTFPLRSVDIISLNPYAMASAVNRTFPFLSSRIQLPSQQKGKATGICHTAFCGQLEHHHLSICRLVLPGNHGTTFHLALHTFLMWQMAMGLPMFLSYKGHPPWMTGILLQVHDCK